METLGIAIRIVSSGECVVVGVVKSLSSGVVNTIMYMWYITRVHSVVITPVSHSVVIDGTRGFNGDGRASAHRSRKATSTSLTSVHLCRIFLIIWFLCLLTYDAC